MCGIVGYVGEKESIPVLIEGLRRLEYRGYDSAGVAVLEPGAGAAEGKLVTKLVRARGKLVNLEKKIAEDRPFGKVGIGHTRWATHGRPSDENAHPHKYGSVSVVHNGIIENHAALRATLTAAGHKFSSETDTEIIAHLVDTELKKGGSLLEAVRRSLAQVQGAYAICVLSENTPGEIVAAKNASPLVLGQGDGENFVASDIPAILEHTRKMIFLDEGDIAEVSRSGIKIIDMAGKPVTRDAKTISWSHVSAEKDGFKHFMLKEIHEQARAVTDTLRGRISVEQSDAFIDGIELDVKALKKITIIACGTSWHAGLVGKFLIESLARIPVEVDLASEYRYRDPIIGPGDTLLAISQSGETADTLAALKEAKAKGAKILCIANVVDSSIPRVSHGALYTHAGPEIGVASTKAFTTQLAALVVLAIHLGRRTGTLDEGRAARLITELLAIPQKMTDVEGLAPQIQVIARRYGPARDFLFAVCSPPARTFPA